MDASQQSLNNLKAKPKKFNKKIKLSLLKYRQEYISLHKSVRIWSYSGSYSVQMRENTDQNNSEYGLFSRSVY